MPGDPGVLPTVVHATALPVPPRLVWPNGAEAVLISADDPEQGRGHNADLVWADELGAWSRARDAWQNVTLALRKGAARSFISTTPRKVGVLLDILGQPTTAVTRASTLDNRAHLSSEFVDQVLSLYRGTRFEAQEIQGLLLEQAEGAWLTASIRPSTSVKPPSTTGA